MSISKTEYILKSLQKISHKNWELFVISRIIHALDDDIEFVRQQLVRNLDGSRYLTDLYFPQFDLHLEIDEPAHDKKVNEDKLREQDIIQVTGHQIERIKISGEDKSLRSIKDICQDIDDFTGLIKHKKETAKVQNRFVPWDFESRYQADPVIKRGKVSIADAVVFRTQLEALRCFGFKGKGWQRGGWTIPDGTNDIVWFPRLYPHGIWRNELVDNGKVIYERPIDDKSEAAFNSIEKQKMDNSQYPDRKYIVFAKAKDVLGFNLLRYVGTFRMNFEESNSSVIRFDRVAIEETVRLPVAG